MTLRCEDLQAQAAGLASLRADDPERSAAEAHARTCPACAAALAQAAVVLDMVDRALPLEAPGADALARARQEILGEIARAETARWLPGDRAGARSAPAATAAVVAALAAVWLLPMLKHLERSEVALGSAAWALAAAAVAAAALTWGRRLLWALPTVALALALALVDGGGGGLQTATGVKCAGLELGLAALPLVLTYVLARRGFLAAPLVGVAAGSGAGALVGQAVLHAACDALPSTSHNLVFHLVPVLLALALGAWAGRTVGARPASVAAPTSPG